MHSNKFHCHGLNTVIRVRVSIFIRAGQCLLYFACVAAIYNRILSGYHVTKLH